MNDIPEIDELLTQTEVEQITKLKPSALEHWRRQGKGIPWVRIGTRAIRYRKSDVIKYLNSLSQEG